MMCHICGNTAVVYDRLMVLDWREKEELREGGGEAGI